MTLYPKGAGIVISETLFLSLFLITIRPTSGLTPECGQQAVTNKSPFESLVVGGQKSILGQWPWQILLFENEFGNTDEFICGGSLITTEWVITAAHCITYEDFPVVYSVKVGSIYNSIENETSVAKLYSVQRVVLHPWYNRLTKNYDIALLQLNKPVELDENVNTVCIPGIDLEFPSGDLCYVTGWGSMYEGGPASDYLMEAKVPLITSEDCSKIYSEVTDQMLCAGYLKGGVDACQGDSGGPLVCKHAQSSGDTDLWYLVGIVSWGKGCGRMLEPGVYTRVNQFEDFIEKTINSTQAYASAILFECDFENTFCNFEQDNKDDFDWQLIYGETPSEDTGPSSAYLGTYYAYIEASAPQKSSQVARIVSPFFDTTGLDTNCSEIEFHYSMYGRGMGELAVYTLLRDSGALNQIWKLEGDQGIGWKTAGILIQNIFASDYQLIFEAKIGNSFTSDIAIDSLVVRKCQYSPENTCIKNLTIESVQENLLISSPNYPMDYSNNLKCLWLISSSPGDTMQVEFAYFDTEYCCDHLSAGNGLDPTNSLSTVIRSHSGSLLPTNFETTENSLWISFNSDYMQTATGFQIKISKSCRFNLSLTTENHLEISSPNYPGYYENDLDCLWTVSGSLGRRILVIFDYLETEPNKDILSIGEGDDPSDLKSVLVSVSGISSPRPFLTNSNKMWISFKSDGSTTYPGFLLKLYDSLDSGEQVFCGFEVSFCDFKQANNGTIPTDNFDWKRIKGGTPTTKTGPESAYQGEFYIYIESSEKSNEQKARLIGPLLENWEEKEMAIQFWYMMYGEDVGKLVVYIESESIMYQVWQATGDQGNQWREAIIVVPNNFTTKFRVILEGEVGTSGPAPNARGDIAIDQIAISTHQFGNKCNNSVILDAESSTILTSPNYPYDYPNSQECRWTFQSFVGDIYVHFLDFETEKDYDIFSAGYENVTVLESHSGSIRPFDFIVERGKEAWLSLHTDAGVTAKGFMALLTASQANNSFSCEEEMFQCENGGCVKPIFVCDGFNNCNDLSDESSCPTPPTDHKNCSFNISLSTSKNFSISSPNFPDDYYLDWECEWYITAPPDKIVGLHFSEFVTEPCCDFVSVYNANNTNSGRESLIPYNSVLNPYAGASLPPDLFSQGNSIIFRFVSDETINFKGFMVEVSAIDSTELPACEDELLFRCDNGRCINKNIKCDNFDDCFDRSDEICHEATQEPTSRPPTKSTTLGLNVCGGNYTLGSNYSVKVQSPNYPGKYESNLNCLWLVTSINREHKISVHFNDFFTEKNDYLSMGNGIDPQEEISQIIDQYSGIALPPNFITVDSSVWITFISDSYPSYHRGFEITLTTTNANVSCKHGDFDCLNGACLDKIQFCDGVEDCGNGQDENNCPNVKGTTLQTTTFGFTTFYSLKTTQTTAATTQTTLLNSIANNVSELEDVLQTYLIVVIVVSVFSGILILSLLFVLCKKNKPINKEEPIVLEEQSETKSCGIDAPQPINNQKITESASTKL